MFPVLIEIGGTKIYSYGFFIALGYVAALLLGRHLCKARGFDPAPFMDLAFVAILSGVVGARLLYVVTNPAQFMAHPSEIFDFWSGGLAFYGGFLLAMVTCYLFGWWRKMPIWAGTDIVVTAVAFAHGFGRIGCFAAGCCYGKSCDLPWTLRNSSDFVPPALRDIPLHPTQLYESIGLFVITFVMVRLVKRKTLRDGFAGLVYLMGYASLRAFVELFRADEDRGFVGYLSTSQVIAAGLFCLGLGVFICRFRRKNL